MISNERLNELYEIFAERAALPSCGLKEDIDVMKALAELKELREPPPPLVPVGGDSDKFICPTCLGEGSVFGDEDVEKLS